MKFWPPGFGPYSTIGPHQGLRITFAQSRSMLTPDVVERADLRDNLTYLIETLERQGASLAPASTVTVPPGALAATMDFVVVTPGYVSVADALQQLQDAMYGPLDLTRRTYIRDVELLGSGGTPFGTPIPAPKEDAEISVGGLVGGALSVALIGALIVGALVYAPEIKATLRSGGRHE